MAAAAVLNRAHVLDPGAVRRARKAAGHTLASAAQGLGRPGSYSLVRRYETGETDPPASVLADLAGLYGVHPGDFFTPTTGPSTT